MEIIPAESLVARTQALRAGKARLVQISATRLADHYELTYSFEVGHTLTNLRLLVTASDPRVPSISSVYWCAFLYENEIHDLFKVQVEGMAVDFKGNLYKATVPYAFGAPPAAKKPPAAAAPPALATASAEATASSPAPAH